MKIKILIVHKLIKNNTLKDLFRVMRVTLILLFVVTLQLVASSGKAQNAVIELKSNNTTIKELINEIEKQTDYLVVYSNQEVNTSREVYLKNKSAKVSEYLTQVFHGTDIDYDFNNNYIVLVKRTSQNATSIASMIQEKQQQGNTITGTVVDTNGDPIIGATIVVQGDATKGTVTDVDGKYRLPNIPENAVLYITYVGMQPQSVPTEGRTTINITLAEDAELLDEVVVVGYGSMKKRDIIGSVSTIKNDVLEVQGVGTNFISSLQGQAAGVNIQTSSGRLGANVDIRVRGESSINANTAPLWIIDGVPIITNESNVSGNWSTTQSPMALINQSDIESIDILKDAAATSIYGSRGSNGVVIVTTKTGKAGKPVVSLDLGTGMSDLPFQQVEFINTTQWFEIMDASKKAGGLTSQYNLEEDFYSGRIYAFEHLTREQASKINTDWRKAIMRKGNFLSTNLSVNGGNEFAQYYISGNFRNDNGVMKNENFKRYGVRSNIDLTPNSLLRLGTKINLSYSKSNRGKNNYLDTDNGNISGGQGGFSYVNQTSVPFQPVYSLTNPNQYYNPYDANPVALQDPEYLVEDLNTYRVLASAYGDYTFPFLRELSARAETSIDFVQNNRNNWVSERIRILGKLGQDINSTSRILNNNFYLTYNKTVNDHNIIAVGGVEGQRSSTWYRQMIGQKLVGDYKELGNPGQYDLMGSSLSFENYLLAFFGRVNYKYKDKYLAGLSMRRDGSSVFTPENRWGTFLALSLGWIISDEEFMEDFGKNNFLKLRGSFGQTGNAGIPGGLNVTRYFEGLPYGGLDILATNGTLVSTIATPTLTWETTNNFDIGIDYGFMNNRINGSLAYYNKYVKDLLLQSAVPPSAGFSSIWGNIGDLVNRGVEFSITSLNVKTKDFDWQTTFNFAYNHNEVKKLNPQLDKDGTGMVNIPYITKVGYPIRDYYLADVSGVNPQTGLLEIYALDKEHYDKTGETIRLKDKTGNDSTMLLTSTNSSNNMFHQKGKSSIPKYYGGLTNQFRYKNVDFSFLVTFSGGNYIFDQFMRDLTYHNTGEITKDYYNNHWEKPGDDAKYQRLTWRGLVKLENGESISLGDLRTYTNQFLFKGDFVKLKNITLGYTLPTGKSSLISAFRIYATLENLYTITQYPGWDPEGQGHIYQWDLPQLFSASIGASIKF